MLQKYRHGTSESQLSTPPWDSLNVEVVLPWVMRYLCRTPLQMCTMGLKIGRDGVKEFIPSRKTEKLDGFYFCVAGRSLNVAITFRLFRLVSGPSLFLFFHLLCSHSNGIESLSKQPLSLSPVGRSIVYKFHEPVVIPGTKWASRFSIWWFREF